MLFTAWELLGLMLAAVLVTESLMPLLWTQRWRQTLAEILRLSDGQIRFFALLACGAGVLMALWALA